MKYAVFNLSRPSTQLLTAVGAALICTSSSQFSAAQNIPGAAGANSDSIGRPERRQVLAISPEASLDEMVAFALRRQPAIAQAKARVQRMLAKVPQAGSLPNPKVRFSAGSMAETAAGRVDWMTAIEQALPYPGKLRRMASAASKEAEAAAMDLEALRISIATQVRLAYWEYFLAARTIEITEANREALGLVRNSVDARVIASQANQNDQLRIATEFGKIERTLIESRQAEGSARAQLNALMNRPAGMPLSRPQFTQPVDRNELRALLTKAEQQHPEVRAATATLDAFQNRLEKANLDRFPDFTIGVQHAAIADGGLAPMANGRDQLIATFGLSIPLWKEPRLGRIREASAGVDESYARRDAVRSMLRYRVEDAWLKTKAATELITLFDKQVLPESRQAFDSSLTAYSAGTQSFVDVLDTWRQQLGFQLQQAGHQAKLGKAATALQSAVGTLP